MTQLITLADFGALSIDHPTEGTARIERVVWVILDDRQMMRVHVSNSTGDQWVFLDPCLQAHRQLQLGDYIHARFTVHGTGRKSKTWATGLRPCLKAGADTETPPEPDVFRALARACRTNRRLVVHGLALAALASDAVREGAFLDERQAKEQLFAAIRTLPRSEAQLLARTAAALEL